MKYILIASLILLFNCNHKKKLPGNNDVDILIKTDSFVVLDSIKKTEDYFKNDRNNMVLRIRNIEDVDFIKERLYNLKNQPQFFDLIDSNFGYFDIYLNNESKRLKYAMIFNDTEIIEFRVASGIYVKDDTLSRFILNNYFVKDSMYYYYFPN